MPDLGKLSAGAVQLMLPAIKRMKPAAFGTREGQPWSQMAQLDEMVNARPQMTPWQRLIQNIPKTSDESIQMRPANIRNNMPGEVKFSLRKPGVAGEVSGALSQDKGRPHSVYVDYINNTGTRRMDIGGGDPGLMDSFVMDISSPAQRELPLRGMKLPQAERTMRAPRPSEERAKMGPVGRETAGLTMRDRQAAADKVMGLLRKSGFKELGFTAEHGERPRLYEMLTGYKAKLDDPMNMLQRMSDRLGGGSPAPHIRGQNPAYEWMNRLTTDHVLDTTGVEQALGMSVDEAVDLGLARQATRDGFALTDDGIRNLTEWLTGGR